MKYITFAPVWFDSLGAKSSCVLVKTPDVSILIDPGIAAMQPSFPASRARKMLWKERGARAIRKASKLAKVVIITHYHYDHFFPRDMQLYRGKILLAKNPNCYINDSQRKRAVEFYTRISQTYGEKISLFEPPSPGIYPNPMDFLPLARSKDFGDYNRRRKELLALGLRWFNSRVKRWNRYRRIRELNLERVKIRWCDGKTFNFGETSLRFTQPLFHGIEFSRVGWVVAVVIEHKREKLLYSSDLNGIYIEDYAELIARENPDALILDGPPTYMGFMLTRTNLQRCIENACRVLNAAKRLKLVIYDHHLLREKRYREKTARVWETGKRRGIRVITAAEYLGKTPVVDTL